MKNSEEQEKVWREEFENWDRKRMIFMNSNPVQEAFIAAREIDADRIAELEQTIKEAIELMRNIDKCCGNYDACDAMNAFIERQQREGNE
jgi:hypothetical protein